MPLLAVPNVSEGRRPDVVQALATAISEAGGEILDRHVDAAHNRAVFTVAGDLAPAMASLAAAARRHIDLTRHEGLHPRVGALDVCPIVPYRESMEAAVTEARRTGEWIAAGGLPVFFYGHAARRVETRELPDLRRGGVVELARRVEHGLAPDLGPARLDPRHGAVCVGARGPLIAFNVWLRGSLEAAGRIAASVRSAGGGPPGVRALALPIAPPETVQVSLNLVDPARTGIDAAFGAVARAAQREGAEVIATEIVGLVEERFLPKAGETAARLLMAPGRTVESVLRN